MKKARPVDLSILRTQNTACESATGSLAIMVFGGCHRRTNPKRVRHRCRLVKPSLGSLFARGCGLVYRKRPWPHLSKRSKECPRGRTWSRAPSISFEAFPPSRNWPLGNVSGAGLWPFSFRSVSDILRRAGADGPELDPDQLPWRGTQKPRRQIIGSQAYPSCRRRFGSGDRLALTGSRPPS
jgi:hypothetical protein